MEKTKRLLMVVTQAEWGGVQGYVFRCAREAQRRGWEVLVVAGGEGLLKTRCREQGISYRRLQKMVRTISPMHDIGGTRELVALMREWKPDVAFLHSSKAGVIGSLAARIAKVPRVVYRIGGWSFLDPVSPLQRALRLWTERATARFKDLIITVHPGDEARAATQGIRPRERVVTIANGLDLDAFAATLLPREEARRVLTGFFTSPVPSDAPLLLSIAHFYPTKDLLGYARALADVAARFPHVRAVILGDGEQRAALEALRKALGLTDVLALPGAQSDASRLLTGADLFVLSSAKEGMPWTVLEAMAAQTPIVTTDVGSNRWVLGDDAWIVPPHDAHALAAACIDALQRPAAARARALRARAALAARFTEQTMWDQLFPLLG